MRRPRDFDAELKALDEKAKELKSRKVQQLGELVITTGADALTPDELAGALVMLAEATDVAKREVWAKRGAAFFRSKSRRSAPANDGDANSAPSHQGGASSPSGGTGAD
ncbi:conjugal transfer protein TraD [Tistrella bauzanensis]|nr:conjugal transfer protein TraD [Tistrella bauzanensis]